MADHHAEQLALRYHREYQIPVVVLRPGFIYGPRDRTVIPKLVDNLPPGMPGDKKIYVKSLRLDSWREIPAVH